MKNKFIAILVLWLGLFPPAIAHECKTNEVDLFVLLKQYSDTHQTNFFIYPSSRVDVNLVIETESVSSVMLIAILNTYGLTVRTKNDIVYVVPIEAAAGGRYGVPWEG